MGTANLTRKEAVTRSAGLLVHEYVTTVDLRGASDPAQSHAPVVTRITLESSLEDTFLDFLDGRVDRVSVDGEPRPVDHDGARIALHLGPGAHVVEVEARAAYSRSGQGLHRFVDPLDGQTYLYTHFEPTDARRLYPCFDQPDLKAVHRIRVLAPKDWTVRSNQPGASSELTDGMRHEFGPTPALSTYLVCLAAGPWHTASGHWEATHGEPLAVDLTVLCRQSLAPHCDADAILEVTRQGLEHYHQTFGFPYPWGKYDQVFVPEYNLGAMENPGLVTFTEAYLPRSGATRAQYQGRANTILHEMAHMWFGDLVTPAWWDDLWLKESFAEYMGAQVSVAATDFRDAWVAFAGRRKAWAYEQDQLPTTHPIVADIADVEAARQNFDGITYAKGASVLKQLVAHVGEDAFLAGVRNYFRAHAFSTARLADLLAALEQTSGRDLGAWSAAWLETAGPDALTPVLEVADGRITRLAIEQTSVDARDQRPVGRPHTLVVGLYGEQDGRLTRTHRLGVDLTGGPVTEVTAASGLPVPALVLVNDEDLTYAKTGLDPASLACALAGVGRIDDPLARALVWSALWNLTRDAALPAGDFVAAVLRQGLDEPDVAALGTLLGQAEFAIDHFLPGSAADDAARNFAEEVWRRLEAAEPGSDAQLVFARSAARLSARVAEIATRGRELLAGGEVIAGLDLGPDLRWSFLRGLAAQGMADEAELDAELARDRAADCVTDRLCALAARPRPEVKQEAWDQLHTPGSLPNDHVDAIVAGFAQPGQEHLVAGFSSRYFDSLDEVWDAHPIEIAQRLVRGLFPATDDAAELAEAWLAAHEDAPAGLRRVVLEQADHARRARRAREAA